MIKNKIKPPTAKAVMAVRGFTLFELLVSISIIAIMTALASVAFSGAQKKARDARRMQDVKAIQTAAEQYYSQSDYVYPTANGVWVSGIGSTILEVFPVDPKHDTTYFYDYQPTTDGYCVCVLMENSSNANSDNDCDFSATTKTHFCAKNQQ